jgi:hypothetical protein
MAVQSYPALDANDTQQTVYNSDDPAEGGGATLEDIRALIDKLDDALQSVANDQLRTAPQSLPSLPAGSNSIGSVSVESLPNSPAQTGDIESLEDAVGDETAANAIEDPTTPGPVQDLLAGVLALLRGPLSGKDADEQLRVDLQSESAGLSSENTLSSVLSELQGALDVSGATVTVTDDGSLVIAGEDSGQTARKLRTTSGGQVVINALDASQDSIEVAAQSADLASETSLTDQESYDAININPATDSVFSTAYNGLLVSSVDGDIEIQTGAGNTKVISSTFLTAGQVLPITVAEVSSTNTTQTLSNVMLVRN